jgi:hypothetical protein
MAYAGRQYLQQHLAADRPGRRLLGKPQRLATLTDLKASHGLSWQVHLTTFKTENRVATFYGRSNAQTNSGARANEVGTPGPQLLKLH